MGAGKTYGIHDVQMRYNKETDEIEILLPGNSSDPTKIIRLPNGGGGSGQGLPAPGNTLIIDLGEINEVDVEDTVNPGVTSRNDQFQLRHEPPDSTNGFLRLEAIGNPTNAKAGFIELRCNGVRVATFAVDALGVTAMGFFDKAEPPLGVQIPAITNATDLPSALIAINSLLAGMRQFGYLAE
jgi:hypothetical protein